MNKTLLVGDLHLGKGTSIGKPGIGTVLNSRISDQVKLLDWIIDTAIDNCVDTIIFTGDICEDVKPDYVLVNIFFQFLKKCEVHNIDIHIIMGNHDLRRTGSHYVSFLDLITTAELSNVSIHKQITTLHKHGVSFTLLPFRDKRSFNCSSNSEALNFLSEKFIYEIAEIPPGWDKVLVGHLALEGSLFVGDEIDDYANELICPLDMFSEYDYVWMGHVHRPQVLAKKPYLAHIGSLDLSDFGETDHKKILVLFDPDNPVKFTEIDVPTRPLRKVIIQVPSKFETTEYVLEQLQVINEVKPFQNAIVRVEVKITGLESKNLDREAVEKLIYDSGAHYICNISESRNVSVVPLNKQANVDNTIKPKVAVKLYADRLDFESEEDRDKYIELSNKVIDKFNASIK